MIKLQAEGRSECGGMGRGGHRGDGYPKGTLLMLRGGGFAARAGAPKLARELGRLEDVPAYAMCDVLEFTS
jgi:hypothetical protein